LIGYFLLGNLFGITTPLQLTELSRPTHPLLRQLLLKASGTYHHTILVSNLAERAAATIGADALLVRVGAYYHDIGKTVRPYFFAENILDGSSPHEKLDPLTSAQIIISHVKDGVDLAQKYKLPDRIQDFIREHHGRSLVKYFYLQAQQQKSTMVRRLSTRRISVIQGRTRSRETAVLMLADTCEAAVRAMRPASREELELMVDRLIDERIASGELNESNLTFRELQIVKEVFLHVLQGVHHPRIRYPDNAKTPALEAATPTPAPANGASAPPYIPPRRDLGGVEEPAPTINYPAAMDG
jgi:putative nucleotidyltransferase with HDIG domain